MMMVSGWRVTPEELLFLGVGITFGEFSDQEMPKEVVWNYWVDDDFQPDEVARKLKELKVPKDLIHQVKLAEHEHSNRNVYFIKWPKNISRLIFRNLLDSVKAREQFAQPIFMDMLYEDLLPLAAAVDAASEDIALTHQSMVKRMRQELREAEASIEEIEEEEQDDRRTDLAEGEGTELQRVGGDEEGDGE